MKNRMIAAISAAVILICAFGVWTSAEEEESTHLWVGGEYVAPEKAADPFGDGTVSFDLETNTLTLNNYRYEGYGTEWPYEDKTSAAAIIYDGDRDLTLVLKGENVVTQTGGADFCCGIYLYSNSSITGTGKLTAKADTATVACYGLNAANKLSIKGGEINVFATGSSPKSAGMHGCGITVADGVINAASSAKEWSIGVYSSDHFIVSGGTVTAAGGRTSDYSAGIYCWYDVTVTGGAVTAAGDAADQYSDGVYCGGNFAMSGGALTAAGGASAEHSTGLYVNGGSADLSGGALTLSGKTAASTASIKSKFGGVGYKNEDGTGEKGFIEPDKDAAEQNYKKITFPHSHTLTKVEAKQPTNRETGNIEYYVCSDCGGYFRDADGKIYIEDKNSVIIPALGDEDAPVKSGFPWVWVVLAAVLACAAAVVIIIIVIKKKKQTEV